MVVKRTCKQCGKSFNAKAVLVKDYGGGKYCSCKCLSESQREGTLAENGFKTCSRCWIERPVGDFYNHKSTKDGLHRQCKICDQNHSYKRKYGITSKGYQNILKDQDGVCVICKSIPKKKLLVVDHCHDKGHVRGLLCDNCNWGLGNFKDSPYLLKEAINYLGKK